MFIPNHCQDVTISFDFGPFTRIFVNEYKFVVGGENNAYHPLRMGFLWIQQRR